MGKEVSANLISQTEIVVTASRISSNTAYLATNSFIIDRTTLDSMGDGNAVSLLRKFGDIHIDNPGGLGGVSSLYLRGAEANYTQILVDGIPLNDPTNSRGGSFDVGTIDLSTVQRIEVLRGPQSAKFGSDAMSGVVNFITKGGPSTTAASLESGLSTKGGHTHRFSARGPIVNGKGFAVIGVTHLDEGRPIEGSSFSNTVVKAFADLNVSSAGQLEVTLRSSKSDGTAFPDDSGGPKFAKSTSVDKREATELATGVKYNRQLLKTWNFELNSSVYRRREIFQSPGVAPGLRSSAGVPVNSSETTFEKLALGAVTEIQFGEEVSSAVGVNFDHESGINNGRLVIGGAPIDNSFVLNRRNIGWFGEGLWILQPRWAISASVRHDVPTDFGGETNFAFGLVRKSVLSGTTVKLNWGEGYKLPSLYALGNDLVGDPTLLPESSRAFEVTIGQEASGGKADIQLSFFRNRYRNTIDFDSSINKLVNRSIVSNWGGGLDMSWRATKLLLVKGHVSLAKNNIRGTKERLKSRPKWKGALHMVWSWRDNATINVSLRRVGRVFGSSIPTGDRLLKAYSVADISGNWLLKSGWRFSLSVDNIFNRKFEEAAGFSDPGTVARVNVRHSF